MLILTNMIHEILSFLPGDHPWQNQILWFDSIESTNTHAKLLARAGAPEGTVVLADHQTGGRGRLGRSFSSPAGLGIYMSVILRPDCLPEELMHLTCATGVYASQAVENTTGKAPGVKWANDLVLGQRKVGGILTEISVNPASRKVDWAVIGIGVNCCQQEKDFPKEIRSIACSLGMPRQGRAPLIAQLICAMHAMRQELFTKKSSMMEDFCRRCITLGQQISILRGDQTQHGKAITVNEDGALLVALDDGTQTWVSSGEVSIRGMYGYV